MLVLHFGVFEQVIKRHLSRFLGAFGVLQMIWHCFYILIELVIMVGGREVFLFRKSSVGVFPDALAFTIVFGWGNLLVIIEKTEIVRARSIYLWIGLGDF